MIRYLIKQQLKIPTAELLVEYLMAQSQIRHPGFLELLMTSMHFLQEAVPEMALNISRRAAFLPIRHHKMIQDTFIVGGTWTFKSQFGNIYKYGVQKWIQDHMYYDVPPRDLEGSSFQRHSQLPLCVGPNSFRKQSPIQTRPVTYLKDIDDRGQSQKGVASQKARYRFYVVPFALIWNVRTKEKTRQLNATPNSFWTSPFFMILTLFWHFVAYDTPVITTHFSEAEVFDNPGMMVLMKYKWNRIARRFWLARWTLQLTYQALVLAVTIVQMDASNENELALKIGFGMITGLGYILLHLEMQQMRGGFVRYFTSPYNYVDLFVYLIPVLASILELAGIHNVINSTRALSFSIVLIYIHFIFELRVFRSICEVVTVIISIIQEIPFFFAILAIFVLAFAHSLGHLIRVNYRAQCPPDLVAMDDDLATSCASSIPQFPTGYLQSVSATYFFMAGNYDSVSQDLQDGHWTLQLMLAMFFFFTSVLMLNVVIALMNGAYSNGVLAGPRIWLRNRIDLIAGAENLTYYLPNYRQNQDTFPRFVYFTATRKQVEEYKKQYEVEDCGYSGFKFKFENSGNGGSHGGANGGGGNSGGNNSGGGGGTITGNGHGHGHGHHLPTTSSTTMVSSPSTFFQGGGGGGGSAPVSRSSTARLDQPLSVIALPPAASKRDFNSPLHHHNNNNSNTGTSSSFMVNSPVSFFGSGVGHGISGGSGVGGGASSSLSRRNNNISNERPALVPSTVHTGPMSLIEGSGGRRDVSESSLASNNSNNSNNNNNHAMQDELQKTMVELKQSRRELNTAIEAIQRQELQMQQLMQAMGAMVSNVQQQQQ